MTLLLCAFLLVAAINFLAWLFLRRRKGERRMAVFSLLLAFNAVFLALAGLEAGFSLFMRQSDGFNLTMSSRNWFADHWKPINSLGYRDDEPTPPGPGQTAVLVVGDSFAAGHGVDDYRDRFSNQLGELLGDGFRAYAVADIGWDSADELRALAAYPVTPRVVVLSYYLNDIYGAAKKQGFALPFGVAFPRNAFLRYLTEHSALVNFAYWRLARMGNVANASDSFWERLKQAFAEPGVWKEHERELKGIADFCREKGARLIVLVFPNLQDVPGSVRLTAKVSAFFQSLGATALDLSPMFQGREPTQLVVNAMDAHPNESVHKEAAGLLKTVILK